MFTYPHITSTLSVREYGSLIKLAGSKGFTVKKLTGFVQAYMGVGNLTNLTKTQYQELLRKVESW